MRNSIIPYIIAVLVTIPGLSSHWIAPAPPIYAVLSGMAIFGASFLLTWACEAAQKDVPQAVAVAVVALIAVLPEYAVDMYFTWMAGQHPQDAYAHYAIANMTGANRLLIGVGWAAVAILYAARFKSVIKLEHEKRTDMLFLALATLYALFIPVKGSLTLVDGCVFLGLYIGYAAIIARRPASEEKLEGPAAIFEGCTKRTRLSWVITLFIFSAAVIALNAEPFSENLVTSGKLLGINEFLLVQWLAPVASEAPEFIIAIMFTLRGNAALALGSLISSKLNQWTLLVGMIPGVYSISFGATWPPIPLDEHQFQEIFLTAAQSIFAVALILGMKLSPVSAWILFTLFTGQLLSPLYAEYVAEFLSAAKDPLFLHSVFAWIYLAFAAVILIYKYRQLPQLLKGFKA